MSQSRYDLHLSAYSISADTIRQVEALGFSRDVFENATRCDITVYHGTFRKQIALPSDQLWSEAVAILQSDKTFVGGLEEECYETEDVRRVSTGAGPEVPQIQQLPSSPPPLGTSKKCDLHLNISLAGSHASAIARFEQIGLASFDKPGDDGIHRVFSATCDDVDAGHLLFERLFALANLTPGLKAKLKFERTTRFFRWPENAPALPLTPRDEAVSWLEATRTSADLAVR